MKNDNIVAFRFWRVLRVFWVENGNVKMTRKNMKQLVYWHDSNSRIHSMFFEFRFYNPDFIILLKKEVNYVQNLKNTLQILECEQILNWKNIGRV